jgi:WD40 repeat protein
MTESNDGREELDEASSLIDLTQAFGRGLVMAVVGGFFWSVIAFGTNIRMVVVPLFSIAYFVGRKVRGDRDSRPWPFGFIGALLGLLGSLIADSGSLWGTVIFQLGQLPHRPYQPEALWLLFKADFQALNALLYLLAAAEGWHFAVRSLHFNIGRRLGSVFLVLGTLAGFGLAFWNIKRSTNDDLDVSPDLRTLAVTQKGHDVNLPKLLIQWDLPANRRHDFPFKSVNRLAWAPDSRSLAVGLEPGVVGIWDPQVRRIDEVVAQPDMVEIFAYAPDGRTFATGSISGIVALWSVPGFQPIGKLSHGYHIASIAFSPDSRRLAVGLRDGTLILRDGPGFAAAEVRPAHVAGILAMTFHGDRLITSGGIDDTINVWDTAPLRVSATFEGGFDWITDLEFAPDGRILAVAGGSFHHSGGVRLLDPANGNEVRRFTTKADTVAAIDFLDDGRTLVAGTAAPISPFNGRRHGEIYRWDVATGRELDPLP